MGQLCASTGNVECALPRLLSALSLLGFAAIYSGQRPEGGGASAAAGPSGAARAAGEEAEAGSDGPFTPAGLDVELLKREVMRFSGSGQSGGVGGAVPLWTLWRGGVSQALLLVSSLWLSEGADRGYRGGLWLSDSQTYRGRTFDALALRDTSMAILCGGSPASAAPGGRRLCETEFMASVLLSDQQQKGHVNMYSGFIGSVGSSAASEGYSHTKAVPQEAGSMDRLPNSAVQQWDQMQALSSREKVMRGSKRSRVYTGLFSRAAPYLAVSFLTFFAFVGCCLAKASMWQPAFE
jgi:hypothetical protein